MPSKVIAAVGTSVNLYLLLAASTHVPWVWAILSWAVSGFLLFTSTGAWLLCVAWLAKRQPVANLLVYALPLLWLAILVVCLVGRRRRVSLAWLLTLGALVFVSHTGPALLALVLDPVRAVRLETFWILPLMLLSLCVSPLAIASGTAFAELTVRAVTWSVLAARPMLASTFWRLAVAVLVGAHITVAMMNPPSALWHVPTTVAIVGGTVALSAWMVSWARRRGPQLPPRPTEIAAQLPRWAYLLAPYAILWFPIVRFVDGVDLSLMSAIGHWAGALAAVVLTSRSIGRGDTIGAALGPALAAGMTVLGIGLVGPELVRERVMYPLLALVLLGALVRWAMLRQLRDLHWLLVSIGLLLLLAIRWRHVLAEPIATALGFSAAVVLFFGLIWRVLTDGEFTRVDGPKFPIESRAFLFGAHAILGATAVALLVFGDGRSIGMDPESMASLGDVAMGRFAMIAVVVGLIELGRFAVDPDPESIVDEFLPTVPARRRRS
ncbi:MAG: hypothetical protein Q4G46_01845 [Propionibacteriaceae bacterium]|nr:hypothetical protein [Propionibacteriaceae bacterium]